LDWPVAQEVVVQEIDFDLKTEVCLLLVIFEFLHKKVLRYKRWFIVKLLLF
jgi:hypothetical protein